MKIKYDSDADTLKHIKRVNTLLIDAAIELLNRAKRHDDSKLSNPEKELFDIYTPKLKGCTYGSDEYKVFLKELSVALDNHYKYNSHHPEHYHNGVDGMCLFDLIEMFLDWKAAGERHSDGNIYKSIEHNRERFGISEQLEHIFINTANKYFTMPEEITGYYVDLPEGAANISVNGGETMTLEQYAQSTASVTYTPETPTEYGGFEWDNSTAIESVVVDGEPVQINELLGGAHRPTRPK